MPRRRSAMRVSMASVSSALAVILTMKQSIGPHPPPEISAPEPPRDPASLPHPANLVSRRAGRQCVHYTPSSSLPETGSAKSHRAAPRALKPIKKARHEPGFLRITIYVGGSRSRNEFVDKLDDHPGKGTCLPAQFAADLTLA
ncbi:exported hypothetical protein [Hyphomicrobiales bacterium]|nr:exported hypothetical protein [Hyphomicrobiales bacterium]